MRPYLLVLASLCGFHQLKAANYYFSSLSGNDSRTIAEASNPLTPWRSLGKLNAVLSSISPGDSFLLKRDEVFDGSILVTQSGTASLPIVFGAYGTGEKPVVNGLSTLENWAGAGNNIWETAVPGGTMVHMVLINGAFTPIGRYPNGNAAYKGYLSIESTNGTSQITDPELAPYPDWTGGEVVIRKTRWVLDRNLITGHSGNTITYISESSNTASPRFGYFIQNHPQTLDVPGEWYCSAGTGKLGVYLASAPFLVQASTVNTLVSLSNQQYIVFNDLSFRGANISAFEIKGGRHISITNCNIMYSGVNAVNAGSSDDVRIENCLIDHTNNIAVNGEGSNNLVIRNNTITNTATVAGSGMGDSGAYEAVMLTGDDHLVERNVIENTGYIPVTFRGSRNVIRNNYINTFAFVKDDGGGIYSWNNIPGASPASGTKVADNTILNGKGAGEGTDRADYLPASGIYMDDNTANVEIAGNTVAHNGLYGIYLHNAHEISVSGNTLYNNKGQVNMTHDQYASYSPVRNVSMQNNILFARQTSQDVARFITSDNDIREFGTFDNNSYSRPLNDNFTIVTGYAVNGNNMQQSIGLEEWKRFSGKDASATGAPVRLASADLIRFEYNATSRQKSIALDQNYIDAKGNKYAGSVNLAPYSSLVLMRSDGPDTPQAGDCPGTGSIIREQWDNATGNDVANIPLQETPAGTVTLTSLETMEIGNQYGARIRGYLCAPQTGSYTFYISGDDAAELWVSTDSSPANKVRIANFVSYTDFRQFDKFPSQQSAPVTLKAGQRYYIEVLHKEGAGGDHVTVAWQLPNGVKEIPIPGKRLSPFEVNGAAKKSSQAITFDAVPSRVFGDAPFSISANATSGLPVSFRVVSGPAVLSGNTVSISGIGPVMIEASQAGNASFNPTEAVTQNFIVAAPAIPGRIEGEHYNAMNGIRTEGCSEGSDDVGYIDAGDWMDYTVNVTTAGTHTLQFRVADPFPGGQLQVRDAAGRVLSSVAIPNTGGWQAWTTVTAAVPLMKGVQTIRLHAVNGGWNLNWWQSVSGTITAAMNNAGRPAAEQVAASRAFSIYPNPVTGVCLLKQNNTYSGMVRAVITGAGGQVRKQFKWMKQGRHAVQQLHVEDLPSGSYIIRVQYEGKHEELIMVKW